MRAAQGFLIAWGARQARAQAMQPLRAETRSLEELHKAALAEGGQLVVYGGGDLPNGAAGVEQAFMKRFPGMKVRILVDRSKYQGARIDNQLALGRLQCDAAHILQYNCYDRWKADGQLLPYKPLGWDEVYPDFRDPDGSIVAVGIFAFSAVYNTAQVAEAEAPRDAPDFLDPKWKGRIVLSYPYDDDAILYQFDRIVADHGWDYVRRLLQQDVLWVRGSAPARLAVAKGEKAVSFTSSGPLAPPANATFRFLLPRSDSFLSWAQPCAIFRKARRPEAAKLYLSWLLSSERQAGLAQWPVRRDVPAPGGFKPVFAYNTYPVGFRTFLQDRARLEKVRDQLEQLIGPMAGPNPTGVAGVFPEGGG